MPFKMHKIIFFPEKKIIKKKLVCLPYLIFSDPSRKTLIFIWPNHYDEISLSWNHCADKTSVDPDTLDPANLDLHVYFKNYAVIRWNAKY